MEGREGHNDDRGEVHAAEDTRYVPGGHDSNSTKGSVKVVTGAAKKIIKVGEPVAATVCAFVSGPKKGQTMLAPGTKYKL